MIERLQSASKEAVKAMDETNEKAKKGAEFTSRTGEVLESITNAINQISDMNTQIASAAEEQSLVAEEINRNVISISEVAEQTVVGAGQSSAANDRVNILAGELKELVEGATSTE